MFIYSSNSIKKLNNKKTIPEINSDIHETWYHNIESLSSLSFRSGALVSVMSPWREMSSQHTTKCVVFCINCVAAKRICARSVPIDRRTRAKQNRCINSVYVAMLSASANVNIIITYGPLFSTSNVRLKVKVVEPIHSICIKQTVVVILSGAFWRTTIKVSDVVPNIHCAWFARFIFVHFAERLLPCQSVDSINKWR